MPQLDLHTYFTNFFWLVLIFFTLYVLVLKSFLPIMLKNFIFRKYFFDVNATNIYSNKNSLEFLISRFLFLDALSLSSLNFIIISRLNHSYEFLFQGEYQFFVTQHLRKQVYFDFFDNSGLNVDFELFYFDEN